MRADSVERGDCPSSQPSTGPAGFAANGFVLIPDVITAAECETLSAAVVTLASGAAGARSLLSTPWCADLAMRLRAHSKLIDLVPQECVSVQCTYFEKSSARNWLVPIHQDLSIPVAQRVDNPALRGWSEKEGTLFVQPPVALLEQLVILRLHLDDCGPDDGPLTIVDGSHMRGRIAPDHAVLMRETGPTTSCIAPKGAVLAMHPLLLHASSKSTGTSLRRVLHFVFGPADLPLGLQWCHIGHQPP